MKGLHIFQYQSLVFSERFEINKEKIIEPVTISGVNVLNPVPVAVVYFYKFNGLFI